MVIIRMLVANNSVIVCIYLCVVCGVGVGVWFCA